MLLDFSGEYGCRVAVKRRHRSCLSDRESYVYGRTVASIAACGEACRGDIGEEVCEGGGGGEQTRMEEHHGGVCGGGG